PPLLAVGNGPGDDTDALELDDAAEQGDVAQGGAGRGADLVVAGVGAADRGETVDLDDPRDAGHRAGTGVGAGERPVHRDPLLGAVWDGGGQAEGVGGRARGAAASEQPGQQSPAAGTARAVTTAGLGGDVVLVDVLVGGEPDASRDLVAVGGRAHHQRAGDR